MMKQSSAHPLPVLLTRPETQGQRFVRDLGLRFGGRLQTVLSPLMAPVFLSAPMPEGDFSAVIFTSATGVAATLALRPLLPRRAVCVGRHTAKAATAAGFDAKSADGDAAILLAELLLNPTQGRLLHLRGEESRGSLAGRLTKEGLPTQDLVVYRQDPLPLTEDALALLRTPGPLILPLFSPRTAEIFAKEMPTDSRAQVYVAAFSPAVAEAAAFPHAALVTATRPDADAMLEVIAELIVAASPP